MEFSDEIIRDNYAKSAINSAFFLENFSSKSDAYADDCDGLGNALISNKFSLLVRSKFLGQFGLYFQSISSDTILASVINAFGKPHVRS